MITPQKVFWGPRDGRPAGIRIIEDDREETHFISWSDLERELQQCLLPQLFTDPTGFSFVTRDYHGKRDWLVQIVDAQGAWYCDALVRGQSRQRLVRRWNGALRGAGS
ncbi:MULTISPECIES: hypothetical protein [unclassified Bradyrhizobium]